MEKVLGYLKSRTPGWFVTLATLFLGLITLIIYTARGGNSYSPVSTTAVIIFVVAIITNALILIKDFKVGAYVPFIFYVVGLGVLLNTEMLFISNVLTGIDNNAFDSAYIVMFIFLILTIVCSFASTIMTIHKEEKTITVTAAN